MVMNIWYFNGFLYGTKILSDSSQIKFSKLTKAGNYSKHLTFTLKTKLFSELSIIPD